MLALQDCGCVYRMRIEDLRDKQVEKSGVGGIRRDGSVASIHEDVVPGRGRTMGIRGGVFPDKTLNTIYLMCVH